MSTSLNERAFPTRNSLSSNNSRRSSSESDHDLDDDDDDDDDDDRFDQMTRIHSNNLHSKN